jgi:uncharacterized membrane protein
MGIGIASKGTLAAAALVVAGVAGMGAEARAGVVELVGLSGERPVYARGLSGGGRYAAGRVIENGVHVPARWDLLTGTVLTVPLPQNATLAEAWTVSDNGAVLFGICFINGQRHAFRWATAEGITHVFAPNSGLTYSAAWDGSVLFGNTPQGAYRWNLAGGLQPLSTPAGAGVSAVVVNACSADGSVLVGSCSDSAGHIRGFRWDLDSGQFTLLTAGSRACPAWGVSASGAMIVGVALPDRGANWLGGSTTAATVSPPGNAAAVSFYAACDQGAKVFGRVDDTGDSMWSAMWSATTGLVNLNTYLPSVGVNLGGYVLTGGPLISDDGLVILAADQHEDWGGAIIPAKWVVVTVPTCATSDFNSDGDFGTDQDIEAFFACLSGNCCPSCWRAGADFNGDGDVGTDQDIEAFFRVLAGGSC